MPRKRLSIVQKRKNLEARRIREGNAVPAKAGRPKKTFKLDTVEKMAEIQCPDKELAVRLGISAPTFADRMKNDPEFRDAVERGREKGKTDLRMLIIKHSEGEGGPAVNAAIHRTKHELGWTDRPTDTKHTIDVNIEISSAAERIAFKLDQLRERVLGSGQSPLLPQIEILGDVVPAQTVTDGEFVESGMVECPVERGDGGVHGQPVQTGSDGT